MEAVLLSLFPPGTRVLQSQSYRPDYQPYPMRVHLQTPDDGVRRCVVKINSPDLIKREVNALRLLSRVGLAVPEVLFDPAHLPSENRMEERTLVVLSKLPGRSMH